ncbi:MAG TPA: pyridoxal phosphate-dependent aminotransferase [Pseudonocardiaceae bacterium]|jgi:aspartate aminotransferase|nr:pyridoxal phosphate-dependent aminotransferase [Pseudonocardiaceae bacterium]
MTVSATLAINEEVARRRRAGTKTVALGFGEAGIPVHPLLTAALAEAAPLAGYGPVAGIPEVRTAAAGYWARRGLPTEAEQVVAAPGSKALLYALLRTVRGAVALPRPSWVGYAAQAALLGLTTHAVPTRFGEGGVPDPDALDRAAAAARAEGSPLGAVILTSPDNPTGTLATPETLRALCAVADRHDLLIISDEIYRDLVHDPATPVSSPAELAPDRTVITSGLSKNLALGGWRLGVARFPDTPAGRARRDQVIAIGSEIWSAPAHPVQCAAAFAFTEPDQLRARITASRQLHRRVVTAVAEEFCQAGIPVPAPKAAFYLYPDFSPHRDHLHRAHGISTDADLAQTLLRDHGIATLPGAAFGDRPEALRLRIATSQLYGTDDPQRTEALNSPDPTALPWIAGQLDELRAALAAITQ